MAREKKINVVILGLLNHEDLTGYDIKKRIDEAIGFFWKGSFGNIYPALKELEEGKYIKSRTDSAGNREKIRYRITAKGKKLLEDWLKEEQISNELRYETLLKLFFAGASDRETALRNIEVFEGEIRRDLGILKVYCKSLESIKDDGDHIYYYLTVTFGVDTYEAYLKWCTKAKKILGK
ncbi:MAG: PadR family transcriptional regulator [Lachnospiraceae bacterium]|nr:PadR family transcriptional regulator [Lachnospiraceae bacterium]